MEVLEHSEIVLTADDLRRRVLLDRTKLCTPRSPGVHVSGILKYLAYSPGGALADGKAQREPCDFEETYPTIMACGVMWEEFIVSLYKDWQWQSGERERDGIFGTPDGMTFDLEVWPDDHRLYPRPIKVDCIEEAKFTTKSMRPANEVWWYVRQGMGLCAMSGMNYARYHVCWVHGDYKTKRMPIYTRTLVRFEDAEIERWWAVLLKSKDKADKE